MIMKKNVFLRIFEFFYGLPMFFVNVWKFRKELYSFRWWDYAYTFNLFRRCIIEMKDGKEKFSFEVSERKLLKIKEMNKVIQILNNIERDYYLTEAEKELGEIIFTSLYDVDSDNAKHNDNVFRRATQLEEIEYEELWEILKGKESESNEFNGKGIRSWWD